MINMAMKLSACILVLSLLPAAFVPAGELRVGAAAVDLQADDSMVIAGGKLCIAGWIDGVTIEMKSGRPKDPANPDPRNAVLRVYSADTGTQLSEVGLDAEPVFDAFAAKPKRLESSTQK